MEHKQNNIALDMNTIFLSPDVCSNLRIPYHAEGHPEYELNLKDLILAVDDTDRAGYMIQSTFSPETGIRIIETKLEWLKSLEQETLKIKLKSHGYFEVLV